MDDTAYKLFESLVLEGKTVRTIRQGMAEAGHDLSEYDDADLISIMLEILQGE